MKEARIKNRDDVPKDETDHAKDDQIDDPVDRLLDPSFLLPDRLLDQLGRVSPVQQVIDRIDLF